MSFSVFPLHGHETGGRVKKKKSVSREPNSFFFFFFALCISEVVSAGPSGEFLQPFPHGENEGVAHRRTVEVSLELVENDD